MEFGEVSDNKKALLVLGLIVAMVAILGVITYFFFYKTGDSIANYGNADAPVNFTTPPQESVPNVVVNTMAESAPIATESAAETAPIIAESTPATIDSAPKIVESAPAIIDSAPSAISSLKYTIKPNNADIFVCNDMRNGGWKLPQKCADGLINAVQRLIESNAELIAFEVSGIVDNSPYSGPSAELKQEGLASFRAREGIFAIMRRFSDVAAFEGLSMQEPNMRGFQVRAYYLQK